MAIGRINRYTFIIVRTAIKTAYGVNVLQARVPE
jgi:hypothetical protein